MSITIKAKRRPRILVTQDGTMIACGESYPIAGEPIAMDERPQPDHRSITFDGAASSPTRPKR